MLIRIISHWQNDIIYFGARSGNGLWRSTDAGLTWSNVTSFPSVGTYFQSSTDPLGSDIMGIAWITFDFNSGSNTSLTVDSDSNIAVGSSRIFAGVANMGSDNVFVSEDGGDTWSAIEGQNNTFISHHGQPLLPFLLLSFMFVARYKQRYKLRTLTRCGCT